jgi:hypothetical protein
MRRFLSPRRGSVCLSYAVKSITPKSGKVRVVPMWTAGHQLGRLAGRERMSADDDLVFASALGGHLDGRALRRRSYDSALVTQGHVGRRAVRRRRRRLARARRRRGAAPRPIHRRRRHLARLGARPAGGYQGRRAVCGTLARSGIRASELCDLRIGQVRPHDPGGARVRIPTPRPRPGCARSR